MSTIDELIEQLSVIKEQIREAINTAYGREVISETDCFSEYVEHINGLCPCETYCINFKIIGCEPEEIVPSKCGIQYGGCIEELPTPPEILPGGVFEDYDFIGWKFSLSDTECVTLDDICPITENITLYAYYKIKSQYTVSTDYDNTQTIITIN